MGASDPKGPLLDGSLDSDWPDSRLGSGAAGPSFPTFQPFQPFSGEQTVGTAGVCSTKYACLPAPPSTSGRVR